MAPTLLEELNEMHAFYVAAINVALTEDDLTRAGELAQAYDHDAIELVAARENKTHLLPIRRPQRREPALRRLVSRMSLSHAA